MTQILKVSSSPHIRTGTSTERIMGIVIISLIPCLVAGTYYFGLRSLVLCIVCTLSAVVSEFIMCKLLSHSWVMDLSAVVTGLLLGLSLPSTIPIWQAVFGGALSTGLFKQAFGGIGKNPVNPAIASRVVMLLSFGEMASYPSPRGLDAVSGATPLSFLREGESFGISDLFFGFRGGCIGETCSMAIILGFIILLAGGVISPHVTSAYTGTVFLASLIYENLDFFLALEWCLAGSVLFGAVYMVTDYVSSPTTRRGQVLYGILCGFLTVFIRLYASYPEGVSFAILFANFAVPVIDSLTGIKVFGVEKKKL